uniref:Uncharacterized protein MANES_08G141400 n=1 Tax=Rhizophora mucronata TaxID=61149 RepID=A0A2P2LMV3_RHIMU
MSGPSQCSFSYLEVFSILPTSGEGWQQLKQYQFCLIQNLLMTILEKVVHILRSYQHHLVFLVNLG